MKFEAEQPLQGTRLSFFQIFVVFAKVFWCDTTETFSNKRSGGLKTVKVKYRTTPLAKIRNSNKLFLTPTNSPRIELQN
jgi:hypothetical protein